METGWQVRVRYLLLDSEQKMRGLFFSVLWWTIFIDNLSVENEMKGK